MRTYATNNVCSVEQRLFDDDGKLLVTSYTKNGINNAFAKEKHQVNFYLSSEKRTFTIKLSDGKLYVNPYYFLTMSEKFREQFEAINNVYGEIFYENISVSAMKVVLESVCPTIHQLYPIPIQISDLPAIIPVAKQLKMPILLNLCARVLDEKIPYTIVTPYGYLKYFDLAYRYGLNINIQKKLLYHLLDFDFNKVAIHMDETILSSETGSLYYMALSVKRERFPHDVYSCLLLPSAMQNVRCHRCAERQRLNRRQTYRPDYKNAAPDEILTPCKLCSKLLCEKCIKSPCPSSLEKFLIENPPSRFPKLL